MMNYVTVPARVQLVIHPYDNIHELVRSHFTECDIVVLDEKESFIDHVKSIPKSVQLFLILPLKFSLEILPSVHDMRQVDSIFLLSSTDSSDEEMKKLNRYSKIIGIHEKIDDQIQAIRENIDLAVQQVDMFKFYEENQKSTRDLSKEAGSFLWLRIFKDVALQLPHDEHAKKDLIEMLKMCYRNNKQQLNHIQNFESEYASKSAIYWYTGKPFLYKQLNRALRTEDIGLLYAFRYFIYDLSKELESEFKQQRQDFDTKLHLYRGVQLSTDEVNRLQSNVGQVLSTNGYLSTTIDDATAALFTGGQNEQQKTVLFDIEYDFGSIESVTVASIAHLSLHRDESEFLFDFDATFRLESVEHDCILNLTRIKVTAIDHGVDLMKEYIEVHRKYMNTGSISIVFGFLLIDSGEYDKAEQYFQHLLQQPDTEDIAFVYYYLGLIKYHRGDYDKSLEFYDISYQKLTTANPPREGVLPELLNTIAAILKTRGQYDLALEKLHEGLKISSHYDNYKTKATILSNIANIYRIKGRIDEALNIQLQCLDIQKLHFPSAHKEIAKILDFIAALYIDKDQLDKAFEFSQMCLKMNTNCLPTIHPALATSLHSMGTILTNQGKYDDALQYYIQALNMRQTIYPTGHATVANSFAAIGRVYYLEGSYEQALCHLEKAMHMREIYLPDVTDIGSIDLMKYLGLVLIKLGRAQEALVYLKLTLQMSESVYQAGHHTITDCYTNLGIAYSQLHDYDQAFEYFTQAQSNQRVNGDTVEPIYSARILDNLGICMCKKGENIIGLKYRMKAARIIEKVHPRRQYALWIDTIGRAFHDSDLVDPALECFLMGLNMKLECLPEDDIEIGNSLREIADLYFEKHKMDKEENYDSQAKDYYIMALEIYRKAAHPSIAYTLNCIGSLYEYLHDYQLALDYYSQASIMYDKYFTDDDLMRQMNRLAFNKMSEKVNSK